MNSRWKKTRGSGRSRLNADASAERFLEALEPRRLLNAAAAGGLPFEYFYPEGYAHNEISEFVPIVNPNDTEIRYELHARYETGERDQLVDAGTIAARTRGGVTINWAGSPEDRLVRPDVPYALVLRSSGPVGATMSHYDFGTAIGEAFTSQTSILWTFGEGYKDPATTRDFLVFYNPSDEDAVVAVIIYTAEGEGIPMSTIVGAQRRGGWSLNDEERVPNGAFSIQVISSQPIVAAISHYEINTGRGYGAIGTILGGSMAGVLGSISYDAGNRGAGRSEPPPNAAIKILNTDHLTAAEVTLTFVPGDGGAPLENAERTIVVPPKGSGGAWISELDLPRDRQFGVYYRSNVPVTVTGAAYQGRDGTGMEAVTTAATQWNFGEGFMSRARAGTTVTENLYLFNPSVAPVEATVEFMFTDGHVERISRQLQPMQLVDVRLHELSEITGHGEDVFYGIHVNAVLPIVATFEHWDDDLGGGFATPGTAAGMMLPIFQLPMF